MFAMPPHLKRKMSKFGSFSKIVTRRNIKTFGMLLSLVKKYTSPNTVRLKQWIFRGQSDAEWKLQTTLEREFLNFGGEFSSKGALLNKISLENVESGLLRFFKRKSKNLKSTWLPDKDDIPAWFSLTRHYGGPSRFLDCTYSFSVALFFALKDLRSNGVIWAIDSVWLADAVEKRLKSKGLGEIWNELDEKQTAQNLKTFKSVFKREKPLSLVYPINPYHLNERLNVQQGIFLCPGNINRPFEDNLLEMANALRPIRPVIIKYRIKGNEGRKKRNVSIFN